MTNWQCSLEKNYILLISFATACHFSTAPKQTKPVDRPTLHSYGLLSFFFFHQSLKPFQLNTCVPDIKSSLTECHNMKKLVEKFVCINDTLHLSHTFIKHTGNKNLNTWIF